MQNKAKKIGILMPAESDSFEAGHAPLRAGLGDAFNQD
jgi:hypothetical protein